MAYVTNGQITIQFCQENTLHMNQSESKIAYYLMEYNSGHSHSRSHFLDNTLEKAYLVYKKFCNCKMRNHPRLYLQLIWYRSQAGWGVGISLKNTKFERHHVKIVSWFHFSCTPDRDFLCFYSISHTRTSRPHFDPWRHCYVKIMSPCRFSAYLGFSRSLSIYFQDKMRYLVVSKKKNPLFVWGWDRKISCSQSPFVITRQSSWCRSVIFGTDFSNPSSYS